MKTKRRLHYIFLGISILCFAFYMYPAALPIQLQLQPKSIATIHAPLRDAFDIAVANGRIWIFYEGGYSSSADGMTWTPKIPLEVPVGWIEDGGVYGLWHSPYYVQTGVLSYRGESIWFAQGSFNGQFINLTKANAIRVDGSGEGQGSKEGQSLVKSGNTFYVVDLNDANRRVWSSDDGTKWSFRGQLPAGSPLCAVPVSNSYALALVCTSTGLHSVSIPPSGLLSADIIPQGYASHYDALLITSKDSLKALAVFRKEDGSLWASQWTGMWNEPIKVADYVPTTFNKGVLLFAAARINGGWAIFWVDDRGQSLWKSMIFCRTLSDSGVLSFSEEWGGPMFVTGRLNKIGRLVCDRGSPSAETVHLLWAEETGQAGSYALAYVPYAFTPTQTVTTTLTTMTITTASTATTTTTSTIASITTLSTTITWTYAIGMTTITLGTEVITTPILTTATYELATTYAQTAPTITIVINPPQPQQAQTREYFLWGGLASALGAILTWPTKRGR
ncbi:MAG: hypothetical protein QXG32_01890 [Candidatus Bathyarchaeia archaeon]